MSHVSCNHYNHSANITCTFILFWHIFMWKKSISITLTRCLYVCAHRKGKKKRDRSPSSSSSSSSPSPYPPPFRGKEYMGEGMEHSEEGYTHSRYPPRDYSGPADRGPRDYEGHNTERGRGRGFVSSCAHFVHFFCCICFLIFHWDTDISSSCNSLS